MTKEQSVEWMDGYDEPEVYHDFPAVTIMKGRRSLMFNKPATTLIKATKYNHIALGIDSQSKKPAKIKPVESDDPIGKMKMTLTAQGVYQTPAVPEVFLQKLGINHKERHRYRLSWNSDMECLEFDVNGDEVR